MKNLLRASLLAPLLAGSALVATPAFAQDESEITVSANVAMGTAYRFRGVSYSGGDFAIQGGFDIAHSSGFYVGTWASSLDPVSSGYGNTELDIYGGYSGAISDTISFDVGILYYLYPSASGDTDYWEPYASVTAALGPAEVTAGIAYNWEQDSVSTTTCTFMAMSVSAFPTRPSRSRAIWVTPAVRSRPKPTRSSEPTTRPRSTGRSAPRWRSMDRSRPASPMSASKAPTTTTRSPARS